MDAKEEKKEMEEKKEDTSAEKKPAISKAKTMEELAKVVGKGKITDEVNEQAFKISQAG